MLLVATGCWVCLISHILYLLANRIHLFSDSNSNPPDMTLASLDHVRTHKIANNHQDQKRMIHRTWMAVHRLSSHRCSRAKLLLCKCTQRSCSSCKNTVFEYCTTSKQEASRLCSSRYLQDTTEMRLILQTFSIVYLYWFETSTNAENIPRKLKNVRKYHTSGRMFEHLSKLLRTRKQFNKQFCEYFLFINGKLNSVCILIGSINSWLAWIQVLLFISVYAYVIALTYALLIEKLMLG